MGEVDYSLILDLFNFGTCEIQINKSHCPRTISAIEKVLPIRSRGLKRSGKFTINTNIKTRVENQKQSFSQGEIGVDPSSGNLIIFLDDQGLDKPLNLLGNILNLENIDNVKLTQGLEIRYMSQ